MKKDDEKIESHLHTEKITPGGVMLGVFVGMDDQQNILIDFSGNITQKPVIAATTIKLNKSQIGSQVALMFVEGKLNKPLIMGVIYNPLNEVLEKIEREKAILSSTDNSKNKIETPFSMVDEVKIDGKHIVFEGKEEITLKCGKASINLSKDGKISIRGKYILNRSTGVNKILGGSVQIN